MRLENLLALTQGTLQNQPFVSRFEGISFNAKKVKRGNLFVAFSNAEIDEAILNGAYGIIFDRPTQIADNEIAWIKVDDVDDARMGAARGDHQAPPRHVQLGGPEDLVADSQLIGDLTCHLL